MSRRQGSPDAQPNPFDGEPLEAHDHTAGPRLWATVAEFKRRNDNDAHHARMTAMHNGEIPQPGFDAPGKEEA